MVEQEVVEKRKAKNKLMVAFGVITEEEAKDYIDAIEHVTNVELRALEHERRGITELIGYMEAERRVHLMKIEYYVAKQVLGLLKLTKEQSCEINRMMEKGE